MALQCPKCGSHQDHIFTIEGGKRNPKQYAIERCPRCEFAGWSDNPIPYDEYLSRKRKSFISDDTDNRRQWPHA